MRTTFSREAVRAQANEPPAIIPHWVESQAAAKSAVESRDDGVVWIVKRGDLANLMVSKLTHNRSMQKRGWLMLLMTIRSPLLPALENRYRQVAFPSSALPREQLMSALAARDRNERFLGGTVDEPSKTISLWKGDLKPLIVPFDAFPPTGNGVRPDFKSFSVADYGSTLKFGDYEAGADAVLYEFDPEFRRQLKKRRFAQDKSLGGSIRRLRMQRQLTRGEFPGIDQKTLARIENGAVKNPHPETLASIAKRLGVRADDLESY